MCLYLLKIVVAQTQCVSVDEAQLNQTEWKNYLACISHDAPINIT